jgi:hypothetical protein
MVSTDAELVEFFNEHQGTLTQERSDFLLPQIVDFVIDRKWINASPEYQRRQVWDNKKKSRLIESLLMNVPIPPIYLFENDYNRYEVMDGQQRINAVVDFYKNTLKLSGLEAWKSFEGLTYDALPEKVKRGLDRRRLNSTVIITDLQNQAYGASDIRRQVFDRLNTGGMPLQDHELRNCLYPGKFNQLLIELSSHPIFTDAFEIPRHSAHVTEGKRISPILANNSLFKRMRDCELVLRFFAFRPVKALRGSIPRILDRCMEAHLECEEGDIDQLRRDYLRCLNLSSEMFGDETFQLPGNHGNGKASVPLYDATMIALDRLKGHDDLLVDAGRRTNELLLEKLSDNRWYEVVIGKTGTAKAMLERINLLTDILREASGI